MLNRFAAIFCLFANAAWAGSLTFHDLERVIQDPARQIRSIDQLLSQPEITPSFRSHYTLMFKSRSLQEANPLNPRAIVYGEDAKLIMAFTAAESGMQNSNTLEVIDWDETANRFEFHSIEFPENAEGTVQISEPNPDICMTCHRGPDPRPNWEAYPTWPGAYGGNDDYVAQELVDGEDRNLLGQFLSTAETRPRYRALPGLKEGFQFDGVADSQRHNTELSEDLSQLNSARIFSRIRALPYYDKIKYAVDLEIMGPLRFADQLRNAGLTEIGDLVDTCVHPSGLEPPFRSHVSELVRLFAAFDPNNISWFMSFNPNYQDEMIAPNSAENDFVTAIWTQDPSLKNVPNENDRAAEGWKDLAKSMDLENIFKGCSGRSGILESDKFRTWSWRDWTSPRPEAHSLN